VRERKVKISNVSIQGDGYVLCRSGFYSANDLLPSEPVSFRSGVNKLRGEIDSGIWAGSYLLSMYKHRPKDFTIFDEPKATFDNHPVSLLELSEISCYMDEIYPLFSTRTSVRQLVLRGLRRSGLNLLPDDIKKMFQIDDERFERPISGVGNERFKVMAAIGYSNKKEIYCFPWLSNMRFEYFGNNLSFVLEKLEELGKIVVFPLGESRVQLDP